MAASNKQAVRKTENEPPKVIALKSNKDRVEEHVPLFSINDKEYSVPTKIRPNQGLQIMHVFRMQGETAGVSFMLETLLGSDGYNALIGFDDLEDDDLEAIVDIAFKMVQDATSADKTKN